MGWKETGTVLGQTACVLCKQRRIEPVTSYRGYWSLLGERVVCWWGGWRRMFYLIAYSHSLSLLMIVVGQVDNVGTKNRPTVGDSAVLPGSFFSFFPFFFCYLSSILMTLVFLSRSRLMADRQSHNPIEQDMIVWQHDNGPHVQTKAGQEFYPLPQNTPVMTWWHTGLSFTKAEKKIVPFASSLIPFFPSFFFPNDYYHPSLGGSILACYSNQSSTPVDSGQRSVQVAPLPTHHHPSPTSSISHTGLDTNLPANY